MWCSKTSRLSLYILVSKSTAGHSPTNIRHAVQYSTRYIYKQPYNVFTYKHQTCSEIQHSITLQTATKCSNPDTHIWYTCYTHLIHKYMYLYKPRFSDLSSVQIYKTALMACKDDIFVKWIEQRTFSSNPDSSKFRLSTNKGNKDILFSSLVYMRIKGTEFFG